MSTEVRTCKASQTVEQVLDEAHFRAVTAGQSRAAVLAAIGRPGLVTGAGLKGGALWHYRYETPFCQIFQVVIDDDRVRETGFGIDPRCRRRFP